MPKVLIQSLPMGSTLYQLDGTVITSATTAIPLDVATGTYRVRIRPPLNQYSVK